MRIATLALLLSLSLPQEAVATEAVTSEALSFANTLSNEGFSLIHLGSSLALVILHVQEQRAREYSQYLKIYAMRIPGVTSASLWFLSTAGLFVNAVFLTGQTGHTGQTLAKLIAGSLGMTSAALVLPAFVAEGFKGPKRFLAAVYGTWWLYTLTMIY